MYFVISGLNSTMANSLEHARLIADTFASTGESAVIMSFCGEVIERRKAY